MIDAISDLIAERFNYSNPKLTLEKVEDFREKGPISADVVRKCISPQRSETPALDLKFLLSLLSYLHIVVKLEETKDDPEKYFIPCVLVGNKHNLFTPAEKF